MLLTPLTEPIFNIVPPLAPAHTNLVAAAAPCVPMLCGSSDPSPTSNMFGYKHDKVEVIL